MDSEGSLGEAQTPPRRKTQSPEGLCYNIDLPVTSSVIEASSEHPYLSVSVELDLDTPAAYAARSGTAVEKDADIVVGAKKVTTLSPIQYQKMLRLSEAGRLIGSGFLKIAEVTEMTGYESPTQFRREFRRLYGITPRDAKNGSNRKYNLETISKWFLTPDASLARREKHREFGKNHAFWRMIFSKSNSSLILRHLVEHLRNDAGTWPQG